LDSKTIHLDEQLIESLFSLSSCPPPKPAPRCLPTASISSIKTIHGACFFPCSNKSRTRDAPHAHKHFYEIRT
jgi:hypothetical protein